MDLPRSAINRVRIRAPGTERSSALAAVSRQLAIADLTPSSLPPSAILLVRSVADPLPGMIDIRRPHDTRHTRWHRHVRERIDELARHARRPERGRVPGTADAVLFADDAELMACLALDISLSGDAHSWWRQAVARYAASDSVYSLLRARIEQLPAALSLLDRWRALDEVAIRISPREALELAGALAVRCGLLAVASVIERSGEEYESTHEEPAAASAPEFAEGRDTRVRFAAAAPEAAAPKAMTAACGGPFDRWLPGAPSTFERACQLLVGLAFAIQRPTFELRTRRFARDLAAWLAADRTTGRPLAETGADRIDRPKPSMGAVGTGSPAAVAALPRPAAEIGEPPVSTAATARGEASDGPVLTGAAEGDGPARAGVEDTWDDAAEATQLGGVLYLVNALEHLGLPECFEHECGLASTVGTLGTLEALARVFAGTRGEELAHDPMWAILASVDGRCAHVPPRAEGLRRPGARLPPAWRAQLGDAAPARRDSDQRAIEALRRAAWPPALLEWLERVTPFIGWRIARACGLADVGEAMRLLLEFPARVYSTQSHIDLVTSIENIRVPVRLAGLDRSPGWVRAMQRVVLFHYE